MFLLVEKFLTMLGLVHPIGTRCRLVAWVLVLAKGKKTR